MIGKFTEWLLENTDLLNEANTITNKPIPANEDSKYNTKIMKILRSIEQDGIVLSYSNTKSNYALRYVITPGETLYNVLITDKYDRPQLYKNIIKWILAKYRSKVLLYDDIEELDENKIYITSVERGDYTISSLYKNGKGSKKIPTSFSSAGGIELYDPIENASYIIDFELKGSGRADSAVNTKLREVTSVVIFELFKNGYEKFFQNPIENFDKLKNKIMNLNKMPTQLYKSLNCDLSVIKDIFDFDITNSNNAYRKKAYIIGVNTLKEIINKYNRPKEGLFVTEIKYTGLTTMSSKESTEDLIIVTSYNKLENKTNDIKISLKSGDYKARENTFITFIKRLNMGANILPSKKTHITEDTLYLKGYITQSNGFYVEETQENTAKALFDFADRLNNKNKTKFAEGIKNIILPDPTVEIWNVTENDMKDLKQDYTNMYNYKYVNLIRKRNTQQVVIELYNNKTDKNDSFRFRWYKRKGSGMISEYKILVEPNK